MIKYVCQKEDDGILLSSLLQSRLDVYTATLRKLKAGGGIYLNGESVHVRRPVREGDTVEIDLSKAETPSMIPPEPVPLDIIFESEGLIAVNKPAVSVVHPTCFHRTGTIAAGIAAYYKENGISAGMHLVNRLDLGTSGILLFAKYGLVQERMRRQAETGGYRKIYLGVADTSRVKESDLPAEGNTGTVNVPIARDRTSIIRRKTDPEGAAAITDYKILKTDPARQKALIAFSLVTGRTHQIRVHMSHEDMPLWGDSLYNPAFENLNTHQLLHQYYASFTEPLSGEPVRIECPVSKEISGEFPDTFENGLLKNSGSVLFPFV